MFFEDWCNGAKFYLKNKMWEKKQISAIQKNKYINKEQSGGLGLSNIKIH